MSLSSMTLSSQTLAAERIAKEMRHKAEVEKDETHALEGTGTSNPEALWASAEICEVVRHLRNSALWSFKEREVLNGAECCGQSKGDII